MADARLPVGASSDIVEFIIKNPSGSNTPPFTLRASLASTVLDLKKQLHKEYQGRPEPQSQTVCQLDSLEFLGWCPSKRCYLLALQIIYAGKVLREDGLSVKEFLRPVRVPLIWVCHSAQ